MQLLQSGTQVSECPAVAISKAAKTQFDFLDSCINNLYTQQKN